MKNYHLDVAAIILLFIGLVVSACDYIQSERELSGLKQKIGARTLSHSGVERFIRRVAKEPKGKIRVKFLATNAEAKDYAIALRVMLLRAGYSVEEEPQPWFFLGDAATGVVLAVKDDRALPSHANALADAMKEVGIVVQGQHHSGIGDDEVFVEVGAKP